MNRKRQRRAQAAGVVESLMGGSNKGTTKSGRKSTAQPRPAVTIPPRGIGPVSEPNVNDVLCGRGGRINSHPGNIQFRDIVISRKTEYLAESTKKLEKAHIAAKIVTDIRAMNPPGRFLKEEDDTGLWYDIGDTKAIKKAGQALREDAPDIRPGIDPSSPKKDAKQSSKAKGDSKAIMSPPLNKEKKTKKKASRKASSPITVSVPVPQSSVDGGAQNFPGRAGPWEQGDVVIPSMTVQEQHAQMSMPPPVTQQPMPTYGLPTRLNALSSGMSVGGSKKASRQVMEALGQSQQPPPEDIAFGRNFHPPAAGSALSGHTMSSISGNAMSEISALTDPALSGIGMETGESSMGHPAASGLRLGQNQMRASGRSNHTMNDKLPSFRTMGSKNGSFRSLGTLSRSSSFPDVGSAMAEGATWEDIIEEEARLSSDVSTTGLSLGSFTAASDSRASRSRDMHYQNQGRDSSAMSITSGAAMSLGTMSMQSGASSQWFKNSMQGSAMDDGRSAAMMSDMSSDLSALDLAG